MKIEIKSTTNFGDKHLKILVYGEAGSGKTYLIKTLPDPIIISSESGLLSLRRENIPYIEVRNYEDIRNIFSWIKSSKEALNYKSIAIDSISEIADLVLTEEKDKIEHKDNRAPYGEMNAVMQKYIRLFCQLTSHHVYMTAKLNKIQDDTGKISFSPYMPGKVLVQNISYVFDYVFPLMINKQKDGTTKHALLCSSEGLWLAKDRSGSLGKWQPADLGQVIETTRNRG